MESNISFVDIIVNDDCVVSITVEMSNDYIKELGTADEFNERLRHVVMDLIADLQYKRSMQ